VVALQDTLRRVEVPSRVVDGGASRLVG
jgi:hypothetical protein